MRWRENRLVAGFTTVTSYRYAGRRRKHDRCPVEWRGSAYGCVDIKITLL